MGRSHGSSGGGRSHSSGGGFSGGGRSHSSGGFGGRSHLGSSGSSYSRHHVSRVPGPHIHHHRRGPHIHTSIHVSGPIGALITIIALYVMFFVFPLIISFSGVNSNLIKIETSYNYYQDMITYATQNSSYQMKGVVTGIYKDAAYENSWYLKYTVYNPNNTNQIYVSEYTFSVYDADDIASIKVGDEIMIAVDNPTPPIFDSIDMNYANIELENDPEYDYYSTRKQKMTKTFTIYGIVATSIAGLALVFVIKAMIKRGKERNDNTSLTLPNTTNEPTKPKTQYCAYCGVALETGSNKCDVCGARNDKR